MRPRPKTSRPKTSRRKTPRRKTSRGKTSRRKTSRRVARAAADEQGSTLLIAIFLSVLAIMIVLVVVASSSLYLERKRLFTLADGAALAGAEAWNLDAVSFDDDALDVELRSAAVHAAVAAYLVDAADADGVRLVAAVSDDGRSATVTLRSEWHAPISTDLLPLSVPIEVTTTARSVFH